MIELTEKIENVLYKLEEKMMVLFAENEKLRQQAQQLQVVQAENAALKQEKESNTRKLQDLLSLFDSVNQISAEQNTFAYVAPALVQA